MEQYFWKDDDDPSVTKEEKEEGASRFYVNYMDGENGLNADSARGIAKAEVEPPNGSKDYLDYNKKSNTTELKIIEGDGNYLAYETKNNINNRHNKYGEIHLFVNRKEFMQAVDKNPYFYLLDIVDKNGKHLKLYYSGDKNKTKKLILKAWNPSSKTTFLLNYITEQELKAIAYYLDDDGADYFDITIDWENAGLSIAGTHEYERASTSNAQIMGEANFDFSEGKIYVGSKELGKVSTGANSTGKPLQYPGHIKKLLIR